MSNKFFPRREWDIKNWSSSFRQKIASNYELYGLSEQQADFYAQLDDSFQEAWLRAMEPGMRTTVSVKRKNDLMRSLEAEARKLARIIRANPNVTPEMRIQACLGAPHEGRGTPSTAPAESPRVSIQSVTGRTFTVTLMDSTRKRRKLPGTTGAALFSFTGKSPPTRLKDWNFVGNVTRAETTIDFDHSLPPGTQVWIAAYWLGPRGQRGPISHPVFTYLGGGVSMKGNGAMRLAA